MRKGIVLLSLLFAFTAAAKGGKLVCQTGEEGSYSQGAEVVATVTGDLVTSGDNDYTLTNLEIDYKIYFDSDRSYVWSEGKDSALKVENKKDYKPRVYKGYAKFQNPWKKIFGYVDFIVPKNRLNNPEQEVMFSSFLIMSWMDDHWGGTINVLCSIN